MPVDDKRLERGNGLSDGREQKRCQRTRRERERSVAKDGAVDVTKEAEEGKITR
jgi:hypothetical protein